MTDDSSIFIQDTNDKNGEMGINGRGQGYSTLISDWEDSREEATTAAVKHMH